MPNFRCKLNFLDGKEHGVSNEDIERIFLAWDDNTMVGVHSYTFPTSENEKLIQ